MLVLTTRGGDADAFRSQQIVVGGESFLADVSGALYWPSQRMLIVADLHLEKGSARAHRGRLLPPYDTRATLLKLADVVHLYRPYAVVALGDSFHDVGAGRRMHADDIDLLRMIQDDLDWLWIAGNHDPHIDEAMRGKRHGEADIGGVRLRHEPAAGRRCTEIAGRLHPAAKAALRGATLRRPCFVGDGQRLILPAFGAYTGGLNVLDEAFSPLFGDVGFSVVMLGAQGLYPVRTGCLRAD